jgi:hypothetical protein
MKNLTDPTQGSASNQRGYEETTDYTTSVGAGGVSVTITPVTAKPLATNGGVVNFVYRYLPERYYEATRMTTVAAIEERFGPAFDQTGIVTPLSAAAQFAFENGAQSIVVMPLFKRTTASDPDSVRLQPTTTDAASATTWTQTVYALRDIEDINLICAVNGQSLANQTDTTVMNVIQVIQDHVYYMGTQGQPMMMLAGEDSSASSTVATATTIRSHAGVLQDRYNGDMAQNTVLVSPSRFRRVLPSTGNTEILVGGQYMAAALAGMLAARPTSSPLTRRQVASFSEVSDPRDKAGKDTDAASGLLVVEQKGTAIQVRHSITLDDTSAARREVSVVRAKHRMIASMRQTIDTQIIGQVPADGNAPFTVKNAIIGVLEALRNQGELVDYQGVQARTLTSEPTTVEVRFSYLPAFPLNYVNIVFSIDLTIGDTTTTEVGTV